MKIKKILYWKELKEIQSEKEIQILDLDIKMTGHFNGQMPEGFIAMVKYREKGKYTSEQEKFILDCAIKMFAQPYETFNKLNLDSKECFNYAKEMLKSAQEEGLLQDY
jgi:hypothetical protein